MSGKFFDIPSVDRPSLRHPRTTQERERNGRPEEARFVRRKRSPRRIPTAYEDIFIRCWSRNTSWKLLRKQQYKLRAM